METLNISRKSKGILSTKESAKDTKVSDILDSNLRDLRGLRGETIDATLDSSCVCEILANFPAVTT